MLDLFPRPDNPPRLNRPPMYVKVYLRREKGTPDVVQVGDGLTYFEEGRFESGRVVKVLPGMVETAPLIASCGTLLRPGAKVKYADFYSISRRIDDQV